MVNIQRVGHVVKPLIKKMLKPQSKALAVCCSEDNNKERLARVIELELQSKLPPFLL